MVLYVGIPAGIANLDQQDHGSVVLGPCGEITVQSRGNPVLIFRGRNLAVVRGDGLRNTSGVSQGIVVGADPVGNVTAGRTLCIEILTVRQCRHEYGYLGFDLRVVSVTEQQGFPCVIQFHIDAGMSLDMERCIPIAKPVCVTPAVLAVVQRSFSLDLSCGVVFLPQMLQSLTLACKRAVDPLRVKLPIQFRFNALPGFAVQALRDKFVGYVFRQRVGQILALYKELEPLFAVLSSVRYAVVKGAVLPQQIYGVPDRSPSSDINILIDKKNVKILEEQLHKLGFERKLPEDNAEIRRNRVLCPDYSHQIPSYHEDKLGFYLNVDVNYDIFWSEYEGKRCSIDEFLNDTV